jgi:hypothetical protein
MDISNKRMLDVTFGTLVMAGAVDSKLIVFISSLQLVGLLGLVWDVISSTPYL